MEKRIFIRCSVADNKSRVDLITNEQVKVKDISIGGICLETSQYIDSQKNFKVEIASSDNKKITLTCEVAWSSVLITVEKKDGYLSIYEVGLKFVELTDAEKQFLEKYIAEFAN